MRRPDGQTFSNISATTAAFKLDGGVYSVDVHATFGGGNIQLQKLAADGVTWLPFSAQITADGATSPLYIPAGGQWRFALTTATAAYINIKRVPLEG